MVKILRYFVDFSLVFHIVTFIIHLAALTTLAESNEERGNSSTAFNRNYNEKCPDNDECSKLGGGCISCTFNRSCAYGENVTVECSTNDGIRCAGNKTFERTMICRFCYQTDTWEHTCLPVTSYTSCKAVSSPRERFLTNCTVRSDIICLGNRHFLKNQTCNWTSGYKWTTALALSITLGGFGADRFYLGHWQEGIGKLFSFGGLGVWTLIDVILITVGYLGPADGSLFIR